ncbi:MAG: hypothetical protein WCK17_14150 [Verrucomicrobiota bacterium]
MKPETKRWLAKEWLILLCSALVGSGIHFVNRYTEKKSDYWDHGGPIDARWIHDVKHTELPKFLTASNHDETVEVLRQVLEDIHNSGAAEIKALADSVIATINSNDTLSKKVEPIIPKAKKDGRTQEFLEWKTAYSNSPKGIRRYFVFIFSDLFMQSLLIGAISGPWLYVSLWVPRLTIRAVQTLRRKPERTE